MSGPKRPVELLRTSGVGSEGNRSETADYQGLGKRDAQLTLSRNTRSRGHTGSEMVKQFLICPAGLRTATAE